MRALGNRARATVIALASLVAVALLVATTASAGRASEHPIKVGNITSVTGLGGTFEGYYNGVVAYFKWLNAQGGINGRKVEFIAKDDGGDPAKNAAAARELLLTEKVVALVGDAGISEGGGAPLIASQKVPNIGGWGNGPEWYGEYDNFFTIVSSHGKTKCAPWLAEMALRHGVEPFAQYTIDVPIAHDDAACHFARLRQGKAKNVIPPTFVSPTLADYRPVVKKALDAGAKDLVINLPVDGSLRLIQAAEQLGFKGRYFGAVLAPETILKPLGKLAAKVSGRLYGVSFTRLVSEPSPAINLARKNLPAKYKNDQWSIAGWAAGMMFADAVKKVGDDREKLLAHFQKLDGYTANGLIGPTQWSKGNQPARCVVWLVAKGQTFVRAPKQGKGFSCAKIIDPTKIQ